MKPNDYLLLTGKWENGSMKEFFGKIGVACNELSPLQLIQTFDQCQLTKIDINFTPSLENLEQYRAFCPEWELWIRSVNSKELIFRFIGNQKNLTQMNGWREENSDAVFIEEQEYLLWGEPYDEDSSFKWYTTQIPQMIDYPIAEAFTKNHRAFLITDHFIRADGRVDLVRYKGLEVKK